MEIHLVDEDVLIVKESLQRELGLIESKSRILKEEIEAFEGKYKMSSKEFVNKFDQGKLGDDQDLFEWWGLIKGLKKIEERINKVKAVLSS